VKKKQPKKPKPNRTKVGFYTFLTPALDEDLRRVAEELDLSLVAVVNAALGDFVKKHERRKAAA